MSRRLYAVIPAGGSGTRLWPVSRASKPKFLLPLPGPATMIQETASRLRHLCDAKDILVITGTAHVAEVARQLPNFTSEQIVVEPLPRGSGPAIGLGVAIIAQRDPDAIVGSFAADHVVAQRTEFERAVRAATAAAEQGYLVTIGIQPTYPETGYGYIRTGTVIAELTDMATFKVAEFKEKPDVATAARYLEEGVYN